MLVDVRCLRKDGTRLSQDQIRSHPSRRGELVVFKRSDPWRNMMVPVAALLSKDGVTYLLPPLDHVRVARWRDKDLVLVGLEDTGTRRTNGEHLQAWWVKLLTEQDELKTPQLEQA